MWFKVHAGLKKLTKRLLDETLIWKTVRIRIHNSQWKNKMENGSNPDPSNRSEKWNRSISKKVPKGWLLKQVLKSNRVKWKMDSRTRHGTILKQKSCTYSDGWHRTGPCPHHLPASCRNRVWPPCPPAHTPEGVRLAGRGRVGRPIRSTHALSKHKKYEF